jgi:ribosomal protein S18 acetylase RimI-like enzyme
VSEAKEPPTLPHSLLWATEMDVLPVDRVVGQKDGYLLIRSPGNPGHYFGNLLLFDDPPAVGDGDRWERLFELEFGDEPRVRHRTFGWDRADGALGRAREEFVDRGYQLDESIVLVADPDQVRPHPRENSDVLVRELDPAPAAEEQLWDAVLELQVASRAEEHVEERTYRAFARARLDGYRAHFRAGRGAWYLALDPGTDEVVAGCGVVVTGGRGRYQAVETALSHRRLGICSRLVVEAARRSAAAYGAERFVIAADAGYHALGLYESLGFVPHERTVGVYRRPDR